MPLRLRQPQLVLVHKRGLLARPFRLRHRRPPVRAAGRHRRRRRGGRSGGGGGRLLLRRHRGTTARPSLTARLWQWHDKNENVKIQML